MKEQMNSGGKGDGGAQKTKATATNAGAMKVKGGATTVGNTYKQQGPRPQKSGSTGG